jgi:hypothetical protein
LKRISPHDKEDVERAISISLSMAEGFGKGKIGKLTEPTKSNILSVSIPQVWQGHAWNVY